MIYGPETKTKDESCRIIIILITIFLFACASYIYGVTTEN